MWKLDTIEWIDIELTSFCNIKCPGCLRQEMNDKVGHILNSSYIKFVSKNQYTHTILPIEDSNNFLDTMYIGIAKI